VLLAKINSSDTQLGFLIVKKVRLTTKKKSWGNALSGVKMGIFIPDSDNTFVGVGRPLFLFILIFYLFF